MRERTAKEIVEFFKKMDEKRNFLVDDIYRTCIDKFKDYEYKIDNRIIQEVIKESELRTYEDIPGYVPSAYGVGVSALINLSPEEEIYLKINYPWNFLGMYNEGKNIVIDGDAGCDVGSYMKGGKTMVKGNAEYMVGANMEDGCIVVNGDVEDNVGHGKKGGDIMVEGNAGWHVGACSKGGRIVVKGGAIGKIGKFIEGGEIYIGNFDPEQISKYARIGEIYRGVPGDAELVWKGGRLTSMLVSLRVLKKGF